jgi:hypothetical protein
MFKFDIEDDFTNKKILDKCTHPFCTECIELHFTYKPTCPVCGTVYGKVTGTQPDGTITISRSSRRSLPGHEPHGYNRKDVYICLIFSYL